MWAQRLTLSSLKPCRLRLLCWRRAERRPKLGLLSPGELPFSASFSCLHNGAETFSQTQPRLLSSCSSWFTEFPRATFLFVVLLLGLLSTPYHHFYMNNPRALIHPPYGPKHSTPFKMTPPTSALLMANKLETYAFPDLRLSSAYN